MTDSNIFEFNMKHHSLGDVWGSISKVLENNKQAKILVVHCGVGYLVKYLKDRGFCNVRGIDSRVELIEKGTELCPDLKGYIANANFFREAPKNKHDFYIFLKTLEYQDNATRFIEVVPSGATILATYPNYDDGLTLRHFQTKAEVEKYLKDFMEIQINTQISLFKNTEFMLDQAIFLVMGIRL